MTKLSAMMIVRNEADRFLRLTIPALREFCDEIRVIDDASDDNSYAILLEHDCVVLRNDRPLFFEHEGKARQSLLDFTLEGHPTHLLAIDADEMVGDGSKIREAIETRTSPAGVWNLSMREVWGGDPNFLHERVDGQWGARKVPMLFEVPGRIRSSWRIAPRALACGREPMEVAKMSIRGRAPLVTDVFHLGWTCKTDREERYTRYVKHDGGKFHASAHLQSIMNPDERVKTSTLPWPDGMVSAKTELLARINR